MMHQSKIDKYLIISLDKIENISYLRFQFQKYGLYVYEMGAVNKKEELKESLKENEILFYLDYLLIKVGRVRFELTMYLTSRFYRPLASAFCIPADSKFMTMYILHTMNCIISTHRETRTLTLSQLFLRQPCLPFPPYGHIEGEG